MKQNKYRIVKDNYSDGYEVQKKTCDGWVQIEKYYNDVFGLNTLYSIKDAEKFIHNINSKKIKFKLKKYKVIKEITI